MVDSPDMTTKNDKPYTITVTTLPESRTEIKGHITWDHLSTFEGAAFETLASKINLDGFREGKVPKDVAKKHIPDEILLSDMAELAINSVYPMMLADHSLDVIGRPDVSVTTIARGSNLEFTVIAAIVPTIALPNFKKISAAIALEDAKDVTAADVDKVVDELRQMRAYGHVHGATDEHKHEEPLPEADDAFAKTFGKFETMDEFRAKIKENLMHEADTAARDKRRITILENIISETTFDIPKVIIESEKQKMLAQIEADIARSGASLEDYLKHINKTKEELLFEFTPEAEKRSRFQLVLNAIARQEKTLPSEAEVEAEAQKLMAMYPGADLNRTRAYADMMLTNEKVFELLESK